MEIGPITAVRPVPMIKVSQGAPDLSRIFDVEYLGPSGDDEYTGAKATRGLEDEEDDVAMETEDGGLPAEADVPLNKVSFFA
jgi:hypothetical protein